MTRPRTLEIMQGIHPTQFTAKTNSILNIGSQGLADLIETFNHYGCVLINLKSPSLGREELLGLSQIFGAILPQAQVDQDGIFPIQVMANQPDYANTMNFDMDPHTDGTFEAIPPRVMAMQCEVPATVGGLTKLVDAKSAYRYLQQTVPDCLSCLLRADAFSIRRGHQAATRAVFSPHGDRLHIAFRADTVANVTIHPGAIKPYQCLKTFLQNPDHQLRFLLHAGQVLVFDNTRILHGRTAFDLTEKRAIHGIWLDGHRQTPIPLVFGFNPSEASA